MRQVASLQFKIKNSRIKDN